MEEYKGKENPMEEKRLRKLLSIVLGICLIAFFPIKKIQAEIHSRNFGRESIEKKTSESWMGIYMKGVKVGYSHSQEFSLFKKGKQYRKSCNESWMKVSRLGGNPVEIKTIEENLPDLSNSWLNIYYFSLILVLRLFQK